MFGPQILVASMVPRGPFGYGNRWQYHSRSDRHSKVACWGLLLDLMAECALLRRHAERGVVVFGLNHEMRDFGTRRKKNLDLVLCRPRSEGHRERGRPRVEFAEWAEKIGVVLAPAAKALLDGLPPLVEGPVGTVHVAVEAKACMTAHGKARPRLYDELNSSHLTIHGSSPYALAVGLQMVNLADRFLSPGRNQFDVSKQEPVWNHHDQPRDTESVIEKLRELPRRRRKGEDGFDAFSITVVKCRNDGSPVELVTDHPAPAPGDVYHYEQMVHRLAHLYEQGFGDIG
jgi:hypothetical protein